MFGPVAKDTIEGINFERMRKERAEKARKEMKKQGIATLLVTGSSNTRYLTGFAYAEFQPDLSYVLFFSEHKDEQVVFSHAGQHFQMYDQAPWIKHWRAARASLSGICGAEATREEARLLVQEIKDELQQRGLAGEKIGIVGFDELVRETLRNEKIDIVDAWPLLLEATKTKTIDEINCLAMTASFCGAGWEKFRQIAVPGTTGGWCHHQVAEHMYALGAENVGGHIISGPHTFPRYVTENYRILESGDIVQYPLCGTRYMGYTSCCYRCFKIGQKPTDKEKDWYKKVKEILDKAIDASRIGNTTADAAKFFTKAEHWGWKSEVDLLSVEIGHGIGIIRQAPSTVAYNLPVVNNQWSHKYPQPFEEGMVIAYETLQGEWRVGGARFENMVVITKDGPEILDLYPREEIIVTG